MRIESHIDRAARLVRSLGRCGAADYEVVMEGVMLAATEWFNAALHRMGERQIETDVMHAEFMTLGERRRIEILAPALLNALDEIEEMRALYVRGDQEGGEAAARRAFELLATVKLMVDSALTVGEDTKQRQ